MILIGSNKFEHFQKHRYTYMCLDIYAQKASGKERKKERRKEGKEGVKRLKGEQPEAHTERRVPPPSPANNKDFIISRDDIHLVSDTPAAWRASGGSF